MRVAWGLVASAFLSVHVGNALSTVSRIEPSEFFGTLSFVLTFGTVWHWLWQYAMRHRLPLPIDTGMFLFAAPFLVVPGYVVAAERWRSIVTLGGLLLAYGGTYLGAILLYYALAALRG